MSSGFVCPECRLDYDTLDPAGLGSRIRSVGPTLRSRLVGLDDHILRTRPEPAVWSAVEYTAHVSDAFDVFVEMVRLMRADSSVGRLFWDPDERAIEQRYNEQPVASLLDMIDARSSRLATGFDEVPTADWGITAQFPWGERDLLTMARNAVHEGVHHTQDVDRVIERVSASTRPGKAP